MRLVVFLWWLWGVLLVTLYPTSWGDFNQRSISLLPFSVFAFDDSAVGRPSLLEVVSNVLMFFAGGFLLFALKRKISSVIYLLTACAVVIEIGQFIVGAGRVTSVDDVIWAAVGAALGAGCARLLLPRSDRNQKHETVIEGYVGGSSA
jgi:glycopeptide antibiotics resistance protein